MGRRYFAAIHIPAEAKLDLIGQATSPDHAQRLLVAHMERFTKRRPAEADAQGGLVITAARQPLVLSDQTVPVASDDAELDELINTDASVHMIATHVKRIRNDQIRTLLEHVRDGVTDTADVLLAHELLGEI